MHTLTSRPAVGSTTRQPSPRRGRRCTESGATVGWRAGLIDCLLVLAFCALAPTPALAQSGASPGAGAPTGAQAAAQAAAQAGASASLDALLKQYDEDTARLFPEFATFRGDHRHGDRLSDASPAGRAAVEAWQRDTLARLRSLPRDGLSASQRTSVDLLSDNIERNLQFQAFEGARSLTLGSLFGFQSQFSGLLRASPTATAAQAEQMLARMAAYPRRVEQEIVQLQRGVALGWVVARPVLQRSLAQLDAQLASEARQSPFFEPFTRLGSAIPAPQQDALRERAEAAIATQVLPALRRLRGFAAGDYWAAAPPTGALSTYPGGDAVYALQVARHTTTSWSPRQIHDIGQRELARIRAEMETVMRGTGFQGDFAAFIRFLNTDERFFHKDGAALLAGYRDIAKRIEPHLPRLFAELPRAPFGVRAMPAHLGPDAAETYNGPAPDGSTPGWFNANALGYKRRPTWAMETLVAHETVPGHHTQLARAAEMRDLPLFRRSGGGYTAYSEGWALYAETLGFELGLYTDPYSRFGHLQGQALRAARLVADTGIHALGWSRQQALDFMIERTGEDPGFLSSEVDRYTAQPGQALAYMIGQLKIMELRDKARARLGARFDIRHFHNAVLDSGALPLNVLERVIDDWIAAQAGPL